VTLHEQIDAVVANHARDFGVGHAAHVAPAIER
jgi:hypothetical protein